MAQLVLSAVSTVGAAVGKAGIGSILARTVAGTAASFVAGSIDRLVFGPKKRSVEGPRLDSFTVQASTEGAGVLRVYGRARVAGQLIWAANFKETASETTEVDRRQGRTARRANYLYGISLFYFLCGGTLRRRGRPHWPRLG